jgi:hypothetical protein
VVGVTVAALYNVGTERYRNGTKKYLPV